MRKTRKKAESEEGRACNTEGKRRDKKEEIEKRRPRSLKDFTSASSFLLPVLPSPASRRRRQPRVGLFSTFKHLERLRVLARDTAFCIV